MNPLFKSIACLLAVGCALVLATTTEQQEALKRADVGEEMQLINKSLEGLLSELALIKREATGRLSQMKMNRISSSSSEQLNERIRQTKVSKFVLKRVAELELESLGMRDEMVRLFELQKKTSDSSSTSSSAAAAAPPSAEAKQEDHDFEEAASPTTSTTTTTTAKAISQQEEEEAKQIGFDLEALKKLGEEICKRVDQFGKDAAKNLSDLMEGIKLVFREPNKSQPKGLQQQATNSSSIDSIGGGGVSQTDSDRLDHISTQLESEIEARQATSANSESLRGVHEQLIRLIDNMVQNYLGNMRRAIQRFNNFVDNRRGQRPRSSPMDSEVATAAGQQQQVVVDELQMLSKRFREFTMQWARAVGKQQSPLIDRIPPRGVELWRDFWDTVRKQVRRINQEFWQVSRDMTRMITGRLPPPPSTAGSLYEDNNRPRAAPFYASEQQLTLKQEQELLAKKFQEFYDKLSVTLGEEQQKMDGAIRRLQSTGGQHDHDEMVADDIGKANENLNNLIDEQDDEATRAELTRNVALRMQIQQEINVFGSIFDIMRAFIQRLRESSTVIRDVLTPGAINSNDAVTPGPSIKPTVDQLLEDTINSQRNINGQAKPVLLPNNRQPGPQ